MSTGPAVPPYYSRCILKIVGCYCRSGMHLLQFYMKIGQKKYISSGLSGDDDTVLHREVGLMGSPPPTMKALMAVPSMAKTMMEPMLAKKFPAHIRQSA